MALSRHRSDGETAVAIIATNSSEEPLTVEARHVEVQQDETRRGAAIKALQRMNPIDGDDHRASEVFDALAQRLTDVRVVIDDHDATWASHPERLDLPLRRVDSSAGIEWGVSDSWAVNE